MIGLIFTVSVLVFPIRVEASEEGRRNTALGLGAAAAYLLLTKRDKVPGLVAAGAAAYAYKRYDDAFRKKRPRVTGDTGTAMIGTTEMVMNDDRYYRGRRDRGDQYYRARYSNSPPGWSRGRKKGWHKHSRSCDH